MPEDSNRRVESEREAAPFGLRRSSDGDTAVIAVSGELDLATAQALERELERAQAGSAREIVLDLRELAFIDSTGLRVIVQASRRRADARLVIVRGPAPVQRVFELCGLLGVLTFVDVLPAWDAKPQSADVGADRPAVSGRAATTRRANQAALAATVRELRSRGRRRTIR